MGGIPESIYELMHPLLNSLARNHLVIRGLFGVRLPRGLVVHFDPTTLLLYYALRNTVQAQDRTALEVGIGQGGLLSLALLRKASLQVDGVDCSPQRVSSSQNVANFNRLPANFFVSDLFRGIMPGRRYDLIFFNPPYVPSATGHRLQLTRRMRADSDRVWDGGSDGMQVLKLFLRQAPPFVSERGRILFGVQPMFVACDKVESAIAEAGLRICRRVLHRVIPSSVYVLRRPEDGVATMPHL